MSVTPATTGKPVVFGEYDHLVGIIEESSADQQSDTGVILVTPGMLSNSGPFRLHVEIARQLSESGIPSVRFDLSGIGESLGVGSTGGSGHRSTDEIRQAIEHLGNQTSARQFILLGLCSGADDSFRAAQEIPNVAGFVAIDGLGYPAGSFAWHRALGHHLPRMIRPKKWVSRFRRTWSDHNEPTSMPIGQDIREYPPHDQAARQLEELACRGVQMHFVYTGGVSDYYNHAGQFFSMFPSLAKHDHVTTEFFRDLDHVAYLREDRDMLVDHLVNRMGAMVNAAADEMVG